MTAGSAFIAANGSRSFSRQRRSSSRVVRSSGWRLTASPYRLSPTTEQSLHTDQEKQDPGNHKEDDGLLPGSAIARARIAGRVEQPGRLPGEQQDLPARHGAQSRTALPGRRTRNARPVVGAGVVGDGFLAGGERQQALVDGRGDGHGGLRAEAEGWWW